MALSDDLSQLKALHGRGVLSEEEFSRAKARLLDQQAASSAAPEPPPAIAAINALRRSGTDRWIAGVCGGLAGATGLEAWVWRLVFAVLLLFGGIGLLPYLLLWIFVPSD